MKTRILNAEEFFTNDVIADLSKNAYILLFYFTVGNALGLTRYVQLSDRRLAMSNPHLTGTEIKEAKQELHEKGIVFNIEDWFYLNHDFGYINYSGGSAVIRAKDKEIVSVPEHISRGFQSLVEGLTMGQRPNINNKSEIINQKSETKNQKPEIADPSLTSAKQILDQFNLIYGTTYTPTKTLMPLIEYWLQDYSVEQVKQAITNSKHDPYWKDKLKPIILFRKLDKGKQPVDRIGEFLNTKPERSSHVRIGK